MDDDNLLIESLVSDYGTLSLGAFLSEEDGERFPWLQASRDLRAFHGQVRLFELNDVPPTEEIRNNLTWFLQHHPHLREVKLAFCNLHQHDISSMVPMVDEVLVALTSNVSARLESIQMNTAPSSWKILSAFLAEKYLSLTLMALGVQMISGHDTSTTNEQVVAQFMDDDGANNSKNSRVLVSTPSKHLDMILESLVRIEALHMLHIFAKHDVSVVVQAAQQLLGVALKRNSACDDTKCHSRSQRLMSFHLHNHSPRTRSAAVAVTNHFWEAILTEHQSLQSLMLSGFALPTNTELGGLWQQRRQQSSQTTTLTELHLCQCQVDVTLLLYLAGSLTGLETLRLQKLDCDPHHLSKFLQQWTTSSSSLFRSLSTLDLQGTRLDIIAMNSLCGLLTSFLTKISSLSIGNQWTSKNILSEDVILVFAERLVDMKILSSLTLSHNVSTVSIARALVCAMEKTHFSLRTLRGLKWVMDLDNKDDFQSCQRKMDFYIKWSQRGRCLLHRSVPLSLWALILLHPSDKGEVDVIYSFLRSGTSEGPLAPLRREYST